MKIDAITLRELKMQLKSPFETSFGVSQERRILLVELAIEGVSGWGEVTAGAGPFYNSETTETARHVIGDFIAPLVTGRSLASGREFSALVSRIRGHEMAKAGVENAIWDAEAQLKRIPLWKLIGGELEEIPCGVSLGIRESPASLVCKVEEELGGGYQRIKIKIKPGKDLDYVAAIRREFPDIRLSVDANSAYRLEDARLLKRLDDFDLSMLEQPLAWDDLYSHAQLQPELRTPICLDECIHNVGHARAALELGACRIINIKLGRVGGFTEACRVHDLCRQRSVPVWCGGMLESGIGRAHNIALSTLPGFTLPGDVSASRRYWHEDIIEPEVSVTPRGTIRVPSESARGYEVKRDLVDRLTVRKDAWKAQMTASR